MSKYLASTLQNVQYRSPGFKIIPHNPVPATGQPLPYGMMVGALAGGPFIGMPAGSLLQGIIEHGNLPEQLFKIVRSRGGNCTQPGMAYYRLMQPTGTTSMLGGQSLAVAAEFCGPVAQPGIYSAGALQAAGLLP